MSMVGDETDVYFDMMMGFWSLISILQIVFFFYILKRVEGKQRLELDPNLDESKRKEDD